MPSAAADSAARRRRPSRRAVGMAAALLAACALLAPAAAAAGAEDAAFVGHLEPLGRQGPEAAPPKEIHGGFPSLRELLTVSLGREPNPAETMHDINPLMHPVVLRGAANSWPAVEEWTDDFFRQNWGDEVLDVEEPKVEDRNHEAQKMAMRDFLDVYLDRDRFFAIHTAGGPMMKGMRMPREYTRGLNNLLRPIFWFSSGGTHSVLHRDNTLNINCMVAGRKEWVLFPANATRFMYEQQHHQSPHSTVNVRSVDLDEHPAFGVIAHQTVVVEKGDCLFLPYDHWHQVNSYNRNLAVNLWFDSITPEFFVPRDSSDRDLELVPMDSPEWTLMDEGELEGEDEDGPEYNYDLPDRM